MITYRPIYVLAQLYFDEDWPDEYDSSLDAFDEVVVEDPVLARQLVDSISALLATDPGETALSALFAEYQLLCDPRAEAFTHRQWLEAAIERLTKSLDAPDQMK